MAQSTQQEREALIVSAKIHRFVLAAESSAMAAHLHLSNEQVWKLRQWTKQWNVFLASERQACFFTAEQMGDVEVGSEMVQAVSTDEHNV